MARIKKLIRTSLGQSELYPALSEKNPSTMSKRLPPLNVLRVFDPAARHLSFTKAAEELFVT